MSTRYAALPMYDFAPLRAAHAAFWGAVAAHAGIDAELRVGETFDHADPDLVLAQTCGLPLTTTLSKLGLQLVATPIYAAPGCHGPTHRSVIVAREATALADARGGICAINGYDSNTGMNLLRATLAPLAKGEKIFREVVVTGAHAASMAAVAEGRADLAAIDCVTFAHLARLEPALAARLRIVAETPATPALPLVAPPSLPPGELDSLRRALHAVAASPAHRATCERLLIAGFAELPLAAYDEVGRLARAAADAGYPTLA